MQGKVRSLQNHLRFGLTLCAATLASSCCINNAFAAHSADSSVSAVSSDASVAAKAQSPDAFDSKKMTAAESLYFGSSFEQLPADQRMDKLERGVFGRNRSGSLNKRFERIAGALGAERISAGNSSVAPGQAEHTVSKEAASASAAAADADVSSKLESKSEEKLIATADSSDSKKAQAAEQSETDAPVQALLKSGMAAHKSGQIQIAEGHFKAALALDPRCADAFYNLGSIAESKGDLLSALTNYRAALGINPLDRELQNAVKSVEDDVAKSRATASSAAKNPPVKTIASNAKSKNVMPKTAPSFYYGNNYQGASYGGYTPNAGYVPGSADSKLFNLQTAQNNALMQTQGNYPPLANVIQPAIPVYNVSQQPAPVLNVNQPKPQNSGVNSLLNVLMMSTPLHCPICRLKQMGNW
jgi:tetratricopeptide (TPR) repeat protein